MSSGRSGRAMHATIWPLVVVMLALLLPATASAAGGYNVVTINAECRGFAGNGWHTHEIRLKAKIVARGTTDADFLRIRSIAQRQRNDGSWLVVQTWPGAVTLSYTPDGTTHSLQLGRRFTLPTTDERHGLKPHRLKFTLSAFAGTTERFREVITKTCVN